MVVLFFLSRRLVGRLALCRFVFFVFFLHKVHDTEEIRLDGEVSTLIGIALAGLCVRPTLALRMEARAGSDQMSVVRGGDKGDSSGASGVQVAQLVSELLQTVRREPVLVV